MVGSPQLGFMVKLMIALVFVSKDFVCSLVGNVVRFNLYYDR